MRGTGAAGCTACRRRSWPGMPQAQSAGTVPRSVFWPVPNVDSKLVTFARRHPPVNTGVHETADGASGDFEVTGIAGAEAAATRGEVFAVIDAAFGQRRKTLRAALRSVGRGRPPKRNGYCAPPESALASAGNPSGSPSSRGSLRHAALRGVPAGSPGTGRARAWRYDPVIVTQSVTVRVPAKINLQLAVGPLPPGRLPRPGDGVPRYLAVATRSPSPSGGRASLRGSTA